ncbi:MAG: DNA-binding response OmpR family regulator [Oceanicoccus sp.]|jgi:DNA-binding response OmpR family regulator
MEKIMTKRILIVEDDHDIAGLMQLHLADITTDIVHIDEGEAGLKQAQENHWDVIILDVRLPGMDGLNICKRIRENNHRVPILMVTAKTTELDRVLGLEIGADDYISKPFSVVEFIARVRAAMRRASAMSEKTETENVSLGDINISIQQREATVAEKNLDLTPKEFDLLLHFAKNPGKVFRRAELLDTIWGYGHEGYEHTVNSHINRLRAKLEKDPVNPDYITTVWGVGYKMAYLR